MTIQELFDYTEDQFPSQYPDELKLIWVNQLEKEISDYLSRFDAEIEPVVHEELTEELQIDEPDIYALYVSARSDFANAEYTRYNNKVAMFNQFFEDWKGRYLRNNQTLGVRYIKI